MEQVKVITVGYGHLGRWHAHKAASLVQANLVGICENSSIGQERILADFPDVKIFPSFEGILTQADAFVLATPTSIHRDQVQLLLENKKHVFCEKPLCINVDEGQKLVALAQEKKVLLQVGHSERFHGCWPVLLKEDTLWSSLQFAHFQRLAPFKGRGHDVDVVWDLMIHDIDLLLYLWKEMPQKVSAYGRKLKTSLWDEVWATFEFSSGAKIIIHSSRIHTNEVRQVTWGNDRGTYSMDLLHGIFSNDKEEKQSFTKKDHLLLEHESFYDSVLHNRPAVVSGEDGVRAMILAQKVLNSLEFQCPQVV